MGNSIVYLLLFSLMNKDSTFGQKTFSDCNERDDGLLMDCGNNGVLFLDTTSYLVANVENCDGLNTEDLIKKINANNFNGVCKKKIQNNKLTERCFGEKQCSIRIDDLPLIEKHLPDCNNSGNTPNTLLRTSQCINMDPTDTIMSLTDEVIEGNNISIHLDLSKSDLDRFTCTAASVKGQPIYISTSIHVVKFTTSSKECNEEVKIQVKDKEMPNNSNVLYSECNDIDNKRVVTNVERGTRLNSIQQTMVISYTRELGPGKMIWIEMEGSDDVKVSCTNNDNDVENGEKEDDGQEKKKKDNSTNQNNNKGMILGAVLGSILGLTCLIVIIVIIILILICLIRNKNKDGAEDDVENNENGTMKRGRSILDNMYVPVIFQKKGRYTNRVSRKHSKPYVEVAKAMKDNGEEEHTAVNKKVNNDKAETMETEYAVVNKKPKGINDVVGETIEKEQTESEIKESKDDVEEIEEEPEYAVVNKKSNEIDDAEDDSNNGANDAIVRTEEEAENNVNEDKLYDNIVIKTPESETVSGKIGDCKADFDDNEDDDVKMQDNDLYESATRGS